MLADSGRVRNVNPPNSASAVVAPAPSVAVAVAPAAGLVSGAGPNMPDRRLPLLVVLLWPQDRRLKPIESPSAAAAALKLPLPGRSMDTAAAAVAVAAVPAMARRSCSKWARRLASVMVPTSPARAGARDDGRGPPPRFAVNGRNVLPRAPDNTSFSAAGGGGGEGGGGGGGGGSCPNCASRNCVTSWQRRISSKAVSNVSMGGRMSDGAKMDDRLVASILGQQGGNGRV